MTPYHYTHNNPINRFDDDGNIDWPLTGNSAVNKKDYKNGAWGLKNTVVRTSTYLDTDRKKGQSNPHIGIDYRASVGTAVYSLGDGKVTKIGEISSGAAKGAKFVTVEYKDGDKVRYLHLDKSADGLKTGHIVYEGQIIGESGKTGTGVQHLHIDATNKNGGGIDPEGKKYGTVSNKEFFNNYGGDYERLKNAKEAEQKKRMDNRGQGLVQSY